jgi:hypothetical protein
LTVHFVAVAQPPRDVIESVAGLDPANPFYTASYAAARTAGGELPCVLVVQEGTKTITGCVGFLRGNALTRTLDIPSLPPVPQGGPFWDGLRSFCRQRGVWDVHLDTFASTGAAIPPLGGEIHRRTRREYLLDLTGRDPLSQASINHRRNIARANSAQLRIQRTRDPEACHTHVRLMNASLERRKTRGEAVSTVDDPRSVLTLLASDSGELFQALQGPDVLSSILVLKAQCGGYYHSAGTLPAGMKLGASYFLIAGVARILQQEGAHVFNLGGAGPDTPGLERFKSGFGTRNVALEAATFSVAPPGRRKLRTALRLVRRDPLALLKRLSQVQRFVVYAAAPEAVSPPEHDPAVTFGKLSDDAVRRLTDSPDFHEQAERFRRLGFNDAYGLFVDGDLVHVAWLIGADHDRSVSERYVRLKPGEAEITHAFTKAAARGSGLYPTAIRHLCHHAARQGVRRVFMITRAENTASRHGIERAGLSRSGFLVRVVVPFLSPRSILTVRGHRWHRAG